MHFSCHFLPHGGRFFGIIIVMYKTLIMSFAVAAFSACAFSSAQWLAERNDDGDMLRLRKAYAHCVAHLESPAENVVFPLETLPDGTVKSRLRARRAQLFIDSGLIWGEGIRVEQYDKDGKVDSFLEAENCIVDRKTKTGWVDGDAVISYGKSTVKGRGVHFSVDREFIKIFSKSEIRTTGLKIDPAKTLDIGTRK